MTQASMFITHCIQWNTLPGPHKTRPRAADSPWVEDPCFTLCMYTWGFRAHKHLRSLAPVMNDYGWLWRPNDIRGPCRPKASWHLSYRWGKNLKKAHPGNLSQPGIKPGPAAWQARMLPPAPQRRTSDAVPRKTHIFTIFKLTPYKLWRPKVM